VPEYSVESVIATAIPTAVSKGVATSWPDFASRWKPMLDGVWAFLRQGDLRTDGHNVMVYRGDFPSLEFEVGVVVSGAFEATGPVVPSHLPAGRAAHTTHIGDYSGLGRAYDAVAHWCRANDVTASRTRWEVYGDWDPDPAKVQTDVYWLLQD
jgi:effector-binding domain-containing protein